MKKFYSILFCFGILASATSQTLIATSRSQDATKNHNQRKIVRDYNHHVFVFYQDVINDTNSIYFVRYDSLTSSWSQPEFVTNGTSPAVGIDPYMDTIFLAYQTDELNSRIMLMKKFPDGGWDSPEQISLADSLPNVMPVADVENWGSMIVSWIEKGISADKVQLYRNGEVIEIYSDTSITDFSMATSLAITMEQNIFFALEKNGSHVNYFLFKNNSLSSIADSDGNLPCQSIGSYAPGAIYSTVERIIYKDDNDDIMMNSIEIYGNNFNSWGTYTLIDGPVTNVLIDDVLMPIGFSFLFVKNDVLYHAFSGHDFTPNVTIIDQLGNNPFNPSIAYKHFSAMVVDFVWMEDVGDNEYNIYYKRSNKIAYTIGIDENDHPEGLSLRGSPNPFTNRILLKVYTVSEEVPVMKLYDLRGSVVKTLNGIISGDHEFTFEWNGRNESGVEVKSGTYIVTADEAGKRVNGLIIKN